jgi:hypothetical protein
LRAQSINGLEDFRVDGATRSASTRLRLPVFEIDDDR